MSEHIRRDTSLTFHDARFTNQPPPMPTASPFRIAVLDLYDGEPNQGMRCIRGLMEAADGRHGVPVAYDVYEARLKAELPDLGYDAYISTGGPGSPFDGEGKPWEARYFAWLDALHAHNARRAGTPKHALFICHSFQMLVRHFAVAQVTRRRSQSFGIFPVHPTPAGLLDPLFDGLGDPLYAADFRHWQVVQPDAQRLADLGASILCYEKHRPHVPLERAVMGLRLSPEIVGVQFHPEADPEGMLLHFTQPKRQREIVRKHGPAKYERILERLRDERYLARTYRHVLPNFLERAIGAQRPEALAA